MAKLGTAYVDVMPDFSGFMAPVERALAPLTAKFGKIGTAATVGLAGIGTAALGAGVGLFKLGENFDEAYDTIRTKTGATGKVLDGLKESFRNVVREVPTDFGKASQAISEVRQRLGLTGKPLEALTEQFLELSRLTGSDLSTNIKSVSRLFGDWGVATRDQAGRLDELFRAAQATGVPVDELAQTMTKFGAPLRQLGFDFDQAAAMAGKFEKEGVNTELVLGSMRIALGKMAKAGEKPAETLQRVTEQIKNAGSTADANRKAIELFGARAGPDMAAAIREGRFEVDKLVSTIKSGKETIRGAGRDTQDFSEKWQMFKNRVLVAIEPIAIRVFDFVGDAMDKLSRVDLSGVIGWFKGLAHTLADTFGPAIELIRDLWSEFGPTLIAGFKAFAQAVGGIVGGLLDTLKGVITFIKGVFSGDWGAAWDGIKAIFKGVWEAMKSIVTGLVNQMATAVKLVLHALAGAIGAIWDAIKTATSAAWNAVKGVVSGAIDAIVGFIRAIPSRLADFASTIWEGVKSAFSAAWNAIKSVVDSAIDAIIGFVRAIPGRLADFVGSIWNGIKSAFNTVVTFVGKGVDAIIDFIKSIPGRIPKALFQPIIDAWKTAEDFVKGGKSITEAINIGLDNAITKAQTLHHELSKISPNTNQKNGGGFGNTLFLDTRSQFNNSEPQHFLSPAALSTPAVPPVVVYATFEMDGEIVDVRAKRVIVERDAATAAAVAGGVG